MLTYLKKHATQFFRSDERSLILLTLLVVSAIIAWFGNILLPIFVSIVFAYLLDGLVVRLEKCKVPHRLAALLVFLLFLAAVVVSLLIILPALWQQGTKLLLDLPHQFAQLQTWVSQWSAKTGGVVSVAQVNELLSGLKSSIGQAAQLLLSVSLASISSAISFIIYIFLVPLMVYFFLVDKALLLQDMRDLLPKNRRLLTKAWRQINEQLANYVRGRMIEILIVGSVSYLVFSILGLNYAALLATLVGFSVIVPFVGAAVVTIPLAIIALLQWGFSAQFFTLIIAYAVIQALDANLLVPLLFASAVSLQPVSIIIAVIFFGGLWGFWGIFFAIPLAAVVKVLINALREPILKK